MAILEVRDLTMRFGGVTVVDHVSLSVPEAAFVSIIGPNGAGKTTLFNLISGLYRPVAGSILFHERDITREPAYRRARRGLGRSFQLNSIFPNLPVEENVRLATVALHTNPFHLFGDYRANKTALRRVREVLALVRLDRREAQLAGALSHGDKRKLELAMIVAANSEVLLLDEPTAGMSIEEVPEIVEVIRDIHKQSGKTVMMVEHKMDVVRRLSDRIAVLHYGKLIADDTPEAILKNPFVQSAYLGVRS